MKDKLQERLRNQTVQIRDKSGTLLGTGFFAEERIVITAEHCLRQKDGSIIREVDLYKDTEMFRAGWVPFEEDSKGLALIYVKRPFHQEDRYPLGYCENLHYNLTLALYGYPMQAKDGFFFEPKISEILSCQKGNEGYPTIKCGVRNKVGALQRYDGLSGAPIMIQNCIIGMVAMEDEGGDEVNYLRMVNFTDVRDVLDRNGIVLRKVYAQEVEEQMQAGLKAGKMALYQQAWWLMETSVQADAHITISDRYSIILASLLFGVEGRADIVLASPWRYGLAECLMEEKVRYQTIFQDWKGRCWIEYKDGKYPEWDVLDDGLGIIFSVRAQDCSDALLSELLLGRRRSKKDILVLWNIWSEHAEQAVSYAIKVAGQFRPDEGLDILTIFPVWQEKREGVEVPPYNFLIRETTNEWLQSRVWTNMDIRSFLLRLNAEETDALAWEVYQRYRDGQADELRELFERLTSMCSESVKTLIGFCDGDNYFIDSMEADLLVFKRWFAMVGEEDCSRILSHFRAEKEQVLYWNAVLSNPYCTEYVLKELCAEERREMARLVLSQKIEDCDDIMLYEEVQNIRRKIRPM